jgi:hypothetical protein
MSLKLQGNANLPDLTRQRRFEDALPPGALTPENQLSKKESEYVEELASMHGLATGNPAFGRFKARIDVEATRLRNLQLTRRITEEARRAAQSCFQGQESRRKVSPKTHARDAKEKAKGILVKNEAKNLSIYEIARQVGVHRSTLSRDEGFMKIFRLYQESNKPRPKVHYSRQIDPSNAED